MSDDNWSLKEKKKHLLILAESGDILQPERQIDLIFYEEKNVETLRQKLIEDMLGYFNKLYAGITNEEIEEREKEHIKWLINHRFGVDEK